MSEDRFWPREPPDDAVVLVRAVGAENVLAIRKAIDETGIPYTMGGRRRDHVTFYVPAERRDEAKRKVQARL